MSFNFNFRRRFNLLFGNRGVASLIWANTGVDGNIGFTNGKKTATHTVNVSNDGANASIARKAGKFYFEGLVVAGGTTTLPYSPGIGIIDVNPATDAPSDSTKWIYGASGDAIHNGVAVHSGGLLMPGGVVCGFAIDFDTGNAFVSINGVYQFAGDPVTEANPTFSFPANTQMWPCTQMNSQFPGVTIRGSNIQFSTAPPAGYKSWTGG